MSLVYIRAALETALNTITPAIATAWENTRFLPVESLPYQRVFLLTAQPDNSEFGSNYVEQGILQINLMYPLLTGTAAIAARAEAIRTKFKRGASFEDSGIKVTIEKTAEVSGGREDGTRWFVPVRVRWKAQISS